jgi:hypothetical protein
MGKYYNVVLKCIKNQEIVWLKYRTVNKLQSLFQVVEAKGYTIDFVNLYDAKTKEVVDSYAYNSR